MEDEEMMISEDLKKDLWKVPVEIDMIRDKNIPNAAFRLYCNLLAYARANTTCFPSRKTLADDLRCTVQNIDRLKLILKDEKLQLLDWTQYIGKDGREHNRYTLLKYKPIQKISTMGNKNVPHIGKKMFYIGEQNCSSNNTNNKNTNINNSSSTTSSAKAVVEHASVPVPAVAGSAIEQLYQKYLPEVKIRKSDKLVLEELDQRKLAAYIPYLPHFTDSYWLQTTKQPSILPAVWQALEKFVEGFPYSSAFQTACKKLKKTGVDVEQIIENADTPSQGKQILINMMMMIK